MNRARRRRLVNRAMEVLATVAALVAVAVLAIVVLSVARRGAGAVSWAAVRASASASSPRHAMPMC